MNGGNIGEGTGRNREVTAAKGGRVHVDASHLGRKGLGSGGQRTTGSFRRLREKGSHLQAADGIESVTRYRAHKILGEKCETCGSTEYLEVHHRDRNRENNRLTNLQLLCRSCHRNLHFILLWKKKKPRLVKIGASIKMTVPQPILKALDWKEGDIVNVGVSNGSMIVKKGTKKV